MNVDLTYFKKVSTLDGGAWSGPCLFGKGGNDRFTIWPFPSPSKYNPEGKPNWYCRHDCPDCPGHSTTSGGRAGTIKEGVDTSVSPAQKREEPQHPPSVEAALMYHSALDKEVIQYLTGRGIKEKVIQKYKVGRFRNMLTVPNIIRHKGRVMCYGIKKRFIPPTPPGFQSYYLCPGSIGKSLFGLDVLSKPHRIVVIIEGILDKMLLDSLGIPAVAPFGGGSVWGVSWYRFFTNTKVVINIKDNDKPDQNGKIPGEQYALRRAMMLQGGPKRVITTFPPSPYKDIGEAYLGNVNIKAWLTKLYREQPPITLEEEICTL